MSTEPLRRAAKEMRERAQAATPGPWVVDGSDIHRAGQPGQWVADVGEGSRFVVNAEHIASWHPAVALTVADWLDSVAVGVENRSAFTPGLRHAEGVARAYLGEAS